MWYSYSRFRGSGQADRQVFTGDPVVIILTHFGNNIIFVINTFLRGNNHAQTRTPLSSPVQ